MLKERLITKGVTLLIIGILLTAFLFGRIAINTSPFSLVGDVVPGDTVINPTTYEITLILAVNPTSVHLLNGDKILLPQLQSQWRQLHEGVSWGTQLHGPILRFVLAGKKLLRLPMRYEI